MTREQVNEYIQKYSDDHKYCPNCGSDIYSTTLVGYIFDTGNPDAYRDENRCICLHCQNVHITHDRVSKEERAGVLDKYTMKLIEQGKRVV